MGLACSKILAIERIPQTDSDRAGFTFLHLLGCHPEERSDVRILLQNQLLLQYLTSRNDGKNTPVGSSSHLTMYSYGSINDLFLCYLEKHLLSILKRIASLCVFARVLN